MGGQKGDNMTDVFLYHNSREEKYRTPFGAVPCASGVSLGLTVRSIKPVEAAEIVINTDNGSEHRITMSIRMLQGELAEYYAEIQMPREPGLVWYYFELLIGGERLYYGNNERSRGGVGCIYKTVPPGYQITVYMEGAETPRWYKKAVMYQIFVDRFNNGNKDGAVLNPKRNSFIYGSWEDTPTYIRDCEKGSIVRWDFFGGNLQGVADKLDYLKDLGVSVIYLNPIFEATSNHKYDTADYKNIDPMFGSNEIFRALCEKARSMNISVILDGVFSHTGSDSIYFNRYGNYPGVGAYQSQQSPYYSWYRFKGSRDDYECWWGVDSLPNVNEMDPGYVDFIITGKDSVIKYWMGMGAKGWRLDVADELPDRFIQLIRTVIKEKDSDSILLGEVWEDASNKVSYGCRRAYLLGDELDSVMNYPFRDIMLGFFLGGQDARAVNEALMSIYENYPLHNFYCCMNLIGTHDVPRILTVLGEAPPEEHMTQLQKEAYRLQPEQKQLGVKRLKLLTLIQMTFPGVPSIYYGDEAGLEGYRDPLNRGTYPWGKENTELFEWYKIMTGIRNRYDIFSTGSWFPIYAESDVYGYVRSIKGGRDVFGDECEDNTALILVNRSKDSQCHISADISRWHKGVMYDLQREGSPVDIGGGRLDMTLEPLQGILYIAKL